jgi:hypothetical protein
VRLEFCDSDDSLNYELHTLAISSPKSKVGAPQADSGPVLESCR